MHSSEVLSPRYGAAGRERYVLPALAHCAVIGEQQALSDTSKAQIFIDNVVLSSNEPYPEDSKLYTHIAGTVTELAQNVSMDTPTVLVVHNEEPNAFAIGDFLVIHDGIFEVIKHQEELAGVLAHELSHIKLGHTKQQTTSSTSLMACIGATRAGESEADLYALQMLDRTGINPIGMADFFRRFSVHTARTEDYFGITSDYTHGKPDERAENIDQTFWLADLKNLRYAPSTPLPFQGSDFMKSRATLVTLPDSYAALTPKQKFQFLQRHFDANRANHAQAGDDIEKVAAKKAARKDEVALLKNAFIELCLQEDPTLSVKEIDALIQIVRFDKQRKKPSRDNLDKDTFLFLATKLDHPVLATHGFVMNEKVKSNFIYDLVKDFLKAKFQEDDEAFPLEDLQEIALKLSNYTVGEYVSLQTCFEESVIAHMSGLEKITAATEERYLDFLAECSIPTTDMGSIGGEEFIAIADKLMQRRSKIADNIQDDGHFLKYVATNDPPSLDNKEAHWSASVTARIKALTDTDLETYLSIAIADPSQLGPWQAGELAWLYKDNAPSTYQFDKQLAAVAVGESPEEEGFPLDNPKTAEAAMQAFVARYKDIARFSIAGTAEVFEAQLRRVYAGTFVTHRLFEVAKARDSFGLASILANTDFASELSRSGDHMSPKLWDRLVAIATKAEKDDQDKQKSLLNYVTLGLLSPEVQIKLQVPAAAMLEITKSLSFSDAMKLVFEEYRHLPAYIFRSSINYLIEEGATTLDELEALEKALQNNLSHYIDMHSADLGKASLADTLGFDVYARSNSEYGLRSDELLAALLETGVNDKPLIRYIVERWFKGNLIGSRLNTGEGARVAASKPNALKYWAGAVKESEKSDLSGLLLRLYASDDVSRSYLLRKVMLGTEGALFSREGRKQFGKAFENKCLDYDDSTLSRSLHTFMQSVFAETSASDLYRYLRPVLSDMILTVPEKSTSLGEVATAMSFNLVTKQRYSLPNKPDFVAAMRNKLLLYMDGRFGEVTEISGRHPSHQLLERFPAKEAHSKAAAMDPTGFMLKIAEKSGAIGVRMLQLAGQYFALTPSQEEKFKNVYDNNYFQSRLQAVRVLRREAELSAPLAELLQTAKRISPRAGGGSLMTVYEVEHEDGSREAISIKNPNAEYHAAQLVVTLRTALNDARKRNPNNQGFSLISSLLTDVYDWVNQELNDANFAEKDARFRLQNDSRFNPVDGAYKILVPDTVPTDTLWVRREKFVDGKNLTSLEVTPDHTDIPSGRISVVDYKRVVATIAKNYIAQIAHGVVHSDIHPGNFRVTPDNSAIAIFDRYNLLELTDTEKQLLGGVISAAMTGNQQVSSNLLLGYLLSLEHNKADAERGEAIQQELTTAFESKDITESVSSALVVLKQNGVYVPLKFSLILKNFLALNALSKKAGFTHLFEAFSHS